MEEWVTYSEACVILGLSQRQIQRLVSNGAIEAKMEGKKKYIKVVTNENKGDNNRVTLVDTKGDVTKLADNDSINNKVVAIDYKGDLQGDIVALIGIVNILVSEIETLKETVDKLASELSKKKRWFHWWD